MAQAQSKMTGVNWGKNAAIAFISMAILAGCKPTPQPFDRQPERVRPAAQSSLPSHGAASQDAAQGLSAYDMPPSRVVKVGFLAPLSGRSQELGKALQDAGILALFDKYSVLSGQQASVRVELIPKDTMGTPAGARQAAADAVKEGAELIIGPLFSESVQAIKPLGQSGKVSIISFSNNPAVAGKGVYIFGFNPDEQARRVASYTFGRDINRIAILAPNDEYGRKVIVGLEQVAKLMGRKIEPVVKYSPAGGTLNQDVKALADQGAVGARMGFEALFLPEGGDKLGPILNGLAAQNINPKTVRFISTGVWDDRDLVRSHNLDGAWIASSPPDQYEAFEERFRNAYGYKPPRIASLAYDAVALAATLATSNAGFSQSAITDPGGYSGPANGIFRFRPDGTVERGLAVLEVQDGGFKTLDPAPQSFE